MIADHAGVFLEVFGIENLEDCRTPSFRSVGNETLPSVSQGSTGGRLGTYSLSFNYGLIWIVSIQKAPSSPPMP